MATDLWMVVEYNQASRWPEEAYGPYEEMGDAYEDAIRRATDTALVGRREMYRVARLEFVTDFVEIPEEQHWFDGHDPPSASAAGSAPQSSGPAIAGLEAEGLRSTQYDGHE